MRTSTKITKAATQSADPVVEPASMFDVLAEPRLFDSVLTPLYVAAGEYGLSYFGAHEPTKRSGITYMATIKDGQDVDLTLPGFEAQPVPHTTALHVVCDDFSAIEHVLFYYMSDATAQSFAIRSMTPADQHLNNAPRLKDSREFQEAVFQLNKPEFAVQAGTINDDMTLIKVVVRAKAGRQTMIGVAGVYAATQADAPTLSIIFDDGYTGVYDEAFPALRQRGLKFAISLIADSLGSGASYMTAAQAAEIVAAGNEAVGHGPIGGYGNLFASAFNPYGRADRALDDMRYTRDWLLKTGLGNSKSANTYVWPEGNFGADYELIEMARNDGFICARSGQRAQFNKHLQRMESFTIPVIGHWGFMSAQNVIDQLDEMIASRRDGSLMLHTVGVNDGSVLDISSADFATVADAIADRVAAGGIEIKFLHEQVGA